MWLKKYHFIIPELWPFESVGILNLSARYMYLENCLSYGLESWSADRGWWVDYLCNLKKKKKKIRQIFPWSFENLGFLNLSAKYLENNAS